MNKKIFFDAIRSQINLTTQNVFGFNKILDYGMARNTRLNDLSYALATAWWETAQTMTPVVEANWLSEDWRKKNLRYYPWHGRGLIQTTWDYNYQKMGKELGVNLMKNPDLLLEWEYALPALFVGMEKGMYTGKSFNDYIDDIDEEDLEDLREFIAARRIVNGTDKAKEIGRLGLLFEKALKTSGYNSRVVFLDPYKPVQPIPDVPSVILPEKTKPSVGPSKSIWEVIVDIFKKLFGGKHA